MTLSCGVGRISYKDAKFGVMSSQISQKVYCEESAIWKKTDINSTTNCTALLDEAAIWKQLKKCDDKISCKIDFQDTNKNTLLFKSTSDSSVSALFSKSGNCGDQAYFYAQVPCTIPTSHTTIRKIFGLLIGCVAVLIYLFTVVYFDYIKSVQ